MVVNMRYSKIGFVLSITLFLCACCWSGISPVLDGVNDSAGERVAFEKLVDRGCFKYMRFLDSGGKPVAFVNRGDLRLLYKNISWIEFYKSPGRIAYTWHVIDHENIEVLVHHR